MPMVNIGFNTADKTCVATIDGVAVSDLSEFHMYDTGSGRYQMELCSRVEDRQAGTYKVTRVMAAKDGSLVQADDKYSIVSPTFKPSEEVAAASILSDESVKKIADLVAKTK